MILVAVAVYVAYRLYNSFEVTVDGVVNSSNLKVTDLIDDQEVTYSKNRSKRFKKLEAIDTLISSEDLRRLANGKKIKKSKKKSKKSNVETTEEA